MRSDRGCAHRSGERRRAKLCQGVMRDRGGGSSAEEDGRGLLQPAVILFTSGGATASRSNGLAADLLGFRGGRVRAERGFYRRGFVAKG
jgi:hypothetical protein